MTTYKKSGLKSSLLQNGQRSRGKGKEKRDREAGNKMIHLEGFFKNWEGNTEKMKKRTYQNYNCGK